MYIAATVQMQQFFGNPLGDYERDARTFAARSHKIQEIDWDLAVI
jgi:hypothetical protein